MSLINNPTHPEHYTPEALDAAAACFCGSLPIFRESENVASLTCANRRCGRVAVSVHGIEAAVAAWNLDVRQASCNPHGYMRVEGSGPDCKPRWTCPHCGKDVTP